MGPTPLPAPRPGMASGPSRVVDHGPVGAGRGVWAESWLSFRDLGRGESEC